MSMGISGGQESTIRMHCVSVSSMPSLDALRENVPEILMRI